MILTLHVLVVASSVLTATEGEHWLRFQSGATALCAGLPGGRVRIQPFGMSGDRYVLHEGFDVAIGTKDVSCRGSNPMLLGSRGELGFFSTEQNRPYSELTYVEPRAKQIAALGDQLCVLVEGGAIVCPANWDGSVSSEQKAGDALVAAGPVTQMIPETSCGLTGSGELLCVDLRSALVTRGWKALRQASFAGVVGAQQGCAAMKDGSVECIGDNRYGQRGVAKLEDAAKPNKVPGLTNIVEVAASGAHVCARDRGGDVFCWGKADHRELGNDGFHAAEEVPQCPLDEVAMDAQRKSLEAMRKQCSEAEPPKDPRRDDPCRRMLGNFERSGGVQNIYKSDGVCQTMTPPIRFLPRPVRVRELRGAVALAVTNGMSCALTAEPAMLCWGLGLDEPRVMKLRGPPLPTRPVSRAPVEAKRASMTVSSLAGVCTRTPDGVLNHVQLQPDGKLSQQPVPSDAVEHHCGAGVCRRDGKGVTQCFSPDGKPAPSRDLAHERSPGSLRAMFGQLCVLRADGLLRCGPGFGSGYQSTRVALQLSAYGSIADTLGNSPCALFTDDSVGCVGTIGPPTILWKNVKDVDGLFSNPQLNGCAVMRDGTVQCLGTNAFGQRGTSAKDLKDEVPNTLEGLPEMEEVAAAYRHVCARSKAGEVYCWGEATHGETGRASHTRATRLPNCPFDARMMRAQRENLKKTDERCRGDTPPARCKPFFYKFTEGCQTPVDGVPLRYFSSPTRIEGVKGAVALAVTTGLSCALLEDRTLACWGAGDPDVQMLKLK